MFKVGLVQINNSFFGQNYFPYSVGLFQAFAQRYLTNANRFEFLTPIYKRIQVKEILKKLAHADIIFFSVYVWNLKFSLLLAEKIKKKILQPLQFLVDQRYPSEMRRDF